jgi:uncharacterized membrane protein
MLPIIRGITIAYRIAAYRAFPVLLSGPYPGPQYRPYRAMETPASNLLTPDAMIGHSINLTGTFIDLFGVTVIVAGIVWATAGFFKHHMGEQHYDAYKIRICRSLLLGLEFLVAADIVKTIAIEPTFGSLGVLAGLVVVRTFLSWTLTLEIDGRWPWQKRVRSSPDSQVLGVAQAKGR